MGGEGEMNKSMVVRWAYIKELATMNTRERGIVIIKLYMRGKRSKGWGEGKCLWAKNKGKM